MDTLPRLESFVRLCDDPSALARFWGHVLASPVLTGPDELACVVPDRSPFALGFAAPTRELAPLTGQLQRQQRAHPDLPSSEPGGQLAAHARAREAGAEDLDVGQGPEVSHNVMADPEGGPFCLIAHGNRFLAGTGALGALASDGGRPVGEFWAAALGWPLVWDEGEETAIQHPDGGPKISWGGEPVAPKHGPNRWHPHLRVAPGTEPGPVLERLVTLGARPDAASACPSAAGPSPRTANSVWTMLDPGENEFCVLA